jgi:hypothetical protein
MIRAVIAALACVVGLGGCASATVESYRDEQPVRDLARYFSGTIDGWGVFQDRSGKVVKRFHVKIAASWQGSVGTLDENCTYSDGTRSRRVWTITKLDEHTYEGRADDVVGVATGTAYGNALRWRYVLRLPLDGKVYDVDFDDWMYLMDDRVMLNRSVMSKFGVRLGDLTLSFMRRTP